MQALRFPSTIEIKPSKRNGLTAISVGLVFHIRAIDKRRLKKKIGDLEEPLIDQIEATLKRLLALK